VLIGQGHAIVPLMQGVRERAQLRVDSVEANCRLFQNHFLMDR